VSENLKNGLFRGEIFFSRKKNHPSEGQFFKNDKCKVMSQELFQQGRKATKRYRYLRKQIKKKKFLPPHVFWDPGSEIRDPGWEKTRIRDPG
jgi:hypothetical protein